MLLDSNIIIYSFRPEYQKLQKFVTDCEIFCSAISYVETLGYHKLSDDGKYYLQSLFNAIVVWKNGEAYINGK